MFASCALQADDSEAGDEGVGQATQAIEVGTLDMSNPEHNAVVLIGDVCTGTLVAPDLVLTAAHCGWSDNSFATGGWTPISPVAISFGLVHGAPIAIASADAVSVPPLATSGPWLVDDIALLRLTASVPASIATPRLVYVDRPVTLGSATQITELGFGGGRNRMVMTGSGYTDWLQPDDRLMNAFGYIPDFRGTGTGDRGTNIEQGDGGGPILIADGRSDSTTALIGVLSWWDPLGIATFGPGGEGRPSIRDWLQAKAPQKPDLIVPMLAATCHGTTPRLWVVAGNSGMRTATSFIDVFHDLPAAPAIGTLSSTFQNTGPLAPLQTVELGFDLSIAPGGHWIDVIIDSPRVVDEIDEVQNIRSQFITFPTCL